MIPLTDLLGRQPVLSSLPNPSIENFARNCNSIHLRVGQTLFNEGDNDEYVYFVGSGVLRLIKHNRSLAKFGVGSLLGAHSVDAHWRRPATCRAAKDCKLFVWARDEFEQLLDQFPLLTQAFDKSLHQVAEVQRLQLTELLALGSSRHVQSIIEQLREHHFADGEVVVREGDTGSEVYVVSRGKFGVKKTIGGHNRSIAILEPGNYFGEMSVTQDIRRTATVFSIDDSSCYSFEGSLLRELKDGSPHLSERLTHRAQENKSNWQRVRNETEHQLVLIPKAEIRELSLDRPLRTVDLSNLAALLRFQLFVESTSESDITTLLQKASRFELEAGQPLTGDVDSFVCLVDGRVRLDSYPQQRGFPRESHGFAAKGDVLKFAAESKPQFVAVDQTSGYRIEAPQPAEPDEVQSLYERLEAAAADCLLTLQEPRVHWAGRIPSQAPPCFDLDQYPWVGQIGENECGIASLSAAALYFGIDASYEAIRSTAELYPAGMTLDALAETATQFGMHAERARCSMIQLSKLQLPAVLYWNEEHHVLLYEFNSRVAILADPLIGIIAVNPERLAEHWNGKVVLLSPIHETS